MKVFHKRLGRVVEVIACFDSHWNYYEDEAQTIIRQGLPGVDLVCDEIDVPTDDSRTILPTPTENVESVETKVESAKPVDPQTTKLIYDRKPSGGYSSFEQFQEINADLDLDWERVRSSMKFPEVVKVNVNTSSITEIANFLPGVGRAAAKKIDARKKDGYKDFEQFQQINKDLNLSELAWEKVKELVEF